jgi:hypothetical protein
MLRLGILGFALYQWLVKGDHTWGWIAGGILIFDVVMYFLGFGFGAF